MGAWKGKGKGRPWQNQGGSSSSDTNPRKFKGKCHHCGMTGHMIKHCHKLKAEKKEKKDKAKEASEGKDKANVAEEVLSPQIQAASKCAYPHSPMKNPH